MAKSNIDDSLQWYAQNRGLYKKLTVKIHNIIAEVLGESSITVHAITSRTKDINSFQNKIDDPKYDDPINQITDLSGVRVIAYVEDDLKPICEILEYAFLIDQSNSIDKSDELGTDRVGYRSIHYIASINEERLNLPEYKKFKGLKFEFQVRTILQHAWAEVEHDRNYKFNGVLPPEIKRRFKILAGTLELMDREFNSISRDIDKISKDVTIAKVEDKLNEVKINSTTLKSYLSSYFEDLINRGFIRPNFNADDSELIDELTKFGIKTLDDLEVIIPVNFKENLEQSLIDHDTIKSINYLGVVRNIMMVNNSKKYFAKAWQDHWQGLDPISFNLLNKYLNVAEEFKNYEITIN